MSGYANANPTYMALILPAQSNNQEQ